ncbi:type II toxin-antitoxin system mRNA interferase toxin, RelE/StbE family [Candidatus Wolfebacteria bacterium]|nr:type II toxin-antitoxin system mRNA interferase toxin, RelE/StbE family [Candidatus Wolfebacteria bacterium]
MEINLSSRFKKSFRKIHPRIQNKAIDKISIFKINPFNLNLNTHKLHGEKKEEWAFSVDYFYRISFIFIEDKKVIFTDIGTHDIYK